MVAGISKLAKFPVALPETSLPKDTNPKHVATLFENVFSRMDDPSSFVDDAIWRDIFALTGTLRTFYCSTGIGKAWTGAIAYSASPVKGSLIIDHNAAMVMQLPNGSSWVEVSGSFKALMTNGLVGKCSLMMGVVPSGTGWKIWTIRTVLDDIEGYPSVNQYSAPTSIGLSNGHHEASFSDVVIVGGGQAGLSVAGRLQALGVQYLVIDKYEQIGDSWKSRYDSARLHTPREYSHLPFDRTFPGEDYQEFLTKDDLARGYQTWAQKYSVDRHVWTRSELLGGSWSPNKQEWVLSVRRLEQVKTVRCRFVIMASGAGGQVPNYDNIPGRDSFDGLVLHSQQYTSAQAWSGKRGVVIGTANTAHDVADDMFEAGMLTTMCQRSQTYVMPVEYWSTISGRTYNKNFPTDLADKLQMTGPNAVGRLILLSRLHEMAAAEPERFEALEEVGFSVESKGDIMYHLLERAGGHYIDVGTSKKIADGKIKMKSGAPTNYTKDGLGFADGSTLSADVIVWATGFESNMKDSIRRLFGDETADQVGDYFGVDDEGEVRGAWRLRHPGLIMHGIALGQARFFSKHIALQIKAALDDKPFKAYTETPIPVFQDSIGSSS